MEALKIVLLGDTGVGKTSIVERFIFEKYTPQNQPTLGAMFVTKFITIPNHGPTIKLNIWDTAGQEKYRSIASTYYKQASIALIVYDITSSNTFDEAKKMIKEVKEKLPPDTSVILVGNKIDMVDNEAVSPKTVKEFANNNNLKYAFVSAKDGIGIEDLFKNAVIDIIGSKTIRLDSFPNTSDSTKKLKAIKSKTKQCC